MKRRSFLHSPMLLAAEQEPMETLYIPPAHKVEDLKLIHDFMEEFSFGCIVTAEPALRATHLPVLLERGDGKYGKILGHLARGNPQNKLFDGERQGMIVFQGPHRYISPSWYKSELAVPTWNFATVHVSGRPRRIEDAKMFRDFLGRLVARNESYEDKPWDFGKLPEGYKAGTQSGAVMFEMPIERIEAKFKLGAERTEADRQGVLAGLKKAKPERTMFELTEDWYRRHPKK